MRLTPWFLPFALSAVLLTTAGYAVADSHSSEEEQSETEPSEMLSDEALEEQYGIKAGSVKRAEEGTGTGSKENAEPESAEDEERSPAAGTGGTGSPEDAIQSSEEENKEESDTDGE